MYTPKFSTKRVLGLVMASALAVSGVVAVAGSSEAATATYTLSPKTGPQSAAGQVVTVTGKAFQVGTTSKVGSVNFLTTVCDATWTTGGNATSISVISPTKLVVTAPSLAPSSGTAASTAYNICVYDTTGGALNAANKLIGTAKYTVYPVATVTSVNAVTTGAVKGSSLGGDLLSVVGTNFTKTSVVRIDGVIAKTTFVDATDLTAVTPAHVPAATKSVTVTTEGGAVNATPIVFTYLDTIKVSPAFGDGTGGNVITVTGSGFLSRVFQSTILTVAGGQSVIALNKTAPVYAALGTYAAAQGAGGAYCTNIQVESDTQLSCQVPAFTLASAAGTYTVQIMDSNTTVVSAVTAVSRSAQYTIAAF